MQRQQQRAVLAAAVTACAMQAETGCSLWMQDTQSLPASAVLMHQQVQLQLLLTKEQLQLQQAACRNSQMQQQ